MITEIITQIGAEITAKAAFLQANSYTSVQHMDRFAGQYQPDMEGNICEFPTPAVFFDFDFDFTDDNALSQNGTGLLRLHIVQERYSQSFIGSQDFGIAMRTYKFVEVLNQILHGSQGEDYGKLQRRRYQADKGNSILVTDIVEYTFTVTDDSTNRYANFVSNEGEGSLAIQKQLVQKIIVPVCGPNQYRP